MQYKLRKFINNCVICIGTVVYITCVTLLILMENKTPFQWTGMVASGIMSVLAADTILGKKRYFLYDENNTLFLAIFAVTCILLPVILLV